MFARHKWRDAGTYYYQLGSYKVHETDVAQMWELMCGDKAIKEFLSKCEKERPGSDEVVPVLKNRQHCETMLASDVLNDTTYLAYCETHGRMCRFLRE